MAIAALVFLALAAAVGAGNALRTAAPSAEGVAELKVRAAHVVNVRYAELMGLSGGASSGNRFHRLVRHETDPLLVNLNKVLALTPDEDLLLAANGSRDDARQKLLRQHQADVDLLARRATPPDADVPEGPGRVDGSAVAPSPVNGPLGSIAHALPRWVTAFLLFVFILMDTGEIKRGIVACVPNRLFEPVLSIASDLERALRRYASALFTQCVLLGTTVAVTQTIAGIPFRWAAVIGFFAGMANVMPYAGIATALAGGMAYVLLGDDIRTPLQFVNEGNFHVAVLAAVLVTDAIKNIVYDPMVLGGALKLHPVVIILGIAVGAQIFGIMGALFAVPVIALGGAFAGSVLRQMRAYGEI